MNIKSIIILVFLSISIINAQEKLVENTIWIQKEITWKSYTISDGFGKVEQTEPEATVTLLIFLTNHCFNRFDNDVIIVGKDSLYLDPSGFSTIYKGTWKIKDDCIIINKKLTDEMYHLHISGHKNANEHHTKIDTLQINNVDNYYELNGREKSYILSNYKWSARDSTKLKYVVNTK